MEKLYEILGQVVDGIKTLAPEVWAIYIKQNYVYMTWDILTCIACIIVIVVMVKLSKIISEGELLYIFVAIAAVVFFINLGHVAARAINPEYYALQDLINTFRLNIQ